MWIKFIAPDHRIFPDRRAFYYWGGEQFDLPAEWALEHIARNTAVPIPAPDAPPATTLRPSLGSAPLTVACVRRSGGIYDRIDYVGPLARAVARHLPVPHRFVCLTDAPEREIAGVENIPLVNGWPRFWSKIELFRPGLFDGPVLYLDLDTVICGDIGQLAILPHDLTVAWDMQHGWINSSIMLWRVDLSPVYDAMLADPGGAIAHYERGEGLYGDQGLLQDTIVAAGIGWHWFQQVLPGHVEWHPPGARDIPPAPGTRVALWYGDPKMHSVSSSWLQEHWT